VSTPRTVTLELLRHGPPQNQLLSPLTEYLALCGNHPAVTVGMPFEHNQLLVRLNALMYSDSEETRKLQLTEMAQTMGALLGQVPGLIAELAEHHGEVPAQTHLRLILSASELALLPFELANAPNGFPGAGQPLALQAQAPLCVTREVRRVSTSCYAWPRAPRILFAAASPPGVGPIPLEAHLLALRRVINPWVDRGPTEGEEGAESLVRRLSPHLVVLPQATVGTIRRVCAEQSFTHVHILAHSRRMPGEEEKRYGLALHSDDAPDAADVVDGARLATILRAYRASTEEGVSAPAVVTLAACHGASQGSVVGAGASVAHALHEGGIPLVVASQFPLSFAASVLMVEVLYEGLLWGGDPRRVLTDLRAQLRSRLHDTHDWASLVAYAALPADFDDQLLDVRLEQLRRSSARSVAFVDRLSETLAPRYGESAETRGAEAERFRTQMDDARKDFAVVRGKLLRLLEEIPPEKSRERALVYGRLASIDKREAQGLIIYNRWRRGSEADLAWTADTPKDREEAGRCFKKARDNYRQAYLADPIQTWALVQMLALNALLEDSVYGLDGAGKAWRDVWTAASVLSADRMLWSTPRALLLSAHSNLAELYLLSLLVIGNLVAPGEAEQEGVRHAEELARNGGRSPEVSAARRQIERYLNCFPYYNARFESLRGLAGKIRNALVV
jgi:hypothetical protein